MVFIKMLKSKNLNITKILIALTLTFTPIEAYAGKGSLLSKTRDLGWDDLPHPLQNHILFYTFAPDDPEESNASEIDKKARILAFLNKAICGMIMSDTNSILSQIVSQNVKRVLETKSAINLYLVSAVFPPGTNLDGVDFSGSIFRKANFKQVSLQSAQFTQCDGQKCKFLGSDLGKATFTESKMRNAIFCGIELGPDAQEKKSKGI